MLSKKSGFDWNECFKRLYWHGVCAPFAFDPT
jgi:hypothetical protein